MNRLPIRDRERILHMLVEGSSLKSIARVSKASLNTVTRLLSLAGEYCIGYHNSRVRNLRPKSIQLDEMWTYIYCRKENV